MKMVKSLLLVSAAGLVGVAGAQAADLPVKAKPVEYVKVCSLYGAGFYYIPGTDICMKIGGYVRYQVSTGTSNISFGPMAGPAGVDTRQSGVDVAQRVRSIATFDTRQQTAYGTLRTYVLMGYTHDSTTVGISPAPALYFTRGFIQIAGFTFGKATSFFDFASTAAVAYNAGFLTTSDTGDPGQLVASYTAQFGNGLSATFGMEESRRSATVWAAAPAGPSGATGLYGSSSYSSAGPTADNLGGAGGAGVASRPDFVGNIRVDQAWGSAQVSAAVHDVSAAYYGAPNSTFGGIPGGANSFFEANGHPSDKWGWAVSGGLRLNTPMFGPGDYFQGQVTYTEGAPKYASQSGCGAVNALCNQWSGNSFGFGFLEDAVFSGSAASPGTFNLTTAWSVMASYEHFWTPNLKTSIYGSYLEVTHNADANAQICEALNIPTSTQCDANWKYWSIGSRSQWNVTKDLYVGLDVIYSKLRSGSINNGNDVLLTSGVTGGGTTTMLPAGKQNDLYHTADQDAWAATWRIHRDIVP